MREEAEGDGLTEGEEARASRRRDACDEDLVIADGSVSGRAREEERGRGDAEVVPAPPPILSLVFLRVMAGRPDNAESCTAVDSIANRTPGSSSSSSSSMSCKRKHGKH